MGRFFFVLPMAGFMLVWTLTASSGVAVASASCFDVEVAPPFREVGLPIASGEVTLAGRLFLPEGPGPHPAVVLLHGGGLQQLNEAPLFYAPLLARCGIAALVYDKRGTGASGGAWGEAVFDDFVDDAAAAVALLARRHDVDAGRIGLIGFSQGGRLAPVVAVRHGQVAFVVSVSAPFTPVAETRLYALDRLLRRESLSDADREALLALWTSHFAAIADTDSAALAALDEAVGEAAGPLKTSLLPPPSTRLPQTPTYNSMGRDYTAELQALHIPMLAVYGDRDAVVPVQRSVEALRGVLKKGGHGMLDVKVVPFADHSFTDWTFNQRIKIEKTIVAWILERLAELRSGTPRPGTGQER